MISSIRFQVAQLLQCPETVSIYRQDPDPKLSGVRFYQVPLLHDPVLDVQRDCVPQQWGADGREAHRGADRMVQLLHEGRQHSQGHPDVGERAEADKGR